MQTERNFIKDDGRCYIILILYPDGEKTAAIMFNEEGSCIQATANWASNDATHFA